MTLHVPIGAVSRVLGWLFNWLTKGLMLATYQWSHARWDNRHRLGARWSPLGDHAEYSVRLAQFTDPASQSSRIKFRARNAEVSKLNLVFEAFGCEGRYQQQISVEDLDQRSIIKVLSDVPRADLIEASDRGIFFSVDSYRLRNINVQLRDGQSISLPDSLTASLMHNWLLNDAWAFRWKQRWNCNAIRYAKQGIREFWRFRFGRPRVRIFSPDRTGTKRQPLSRSLMTGLGWVMGCNWLVTVQFWLAIWSHLYILTDKERLEWRWKGQRKSPLDCDTSD
jgi:hypothetical protein